MMNEGMTIELPNFEGPLDLLLHLIRSQELDIYDIPIARITQQYLDYLQQMQRLNLQLAGEYFVMAATLLQIKSRMMLPQQSKEKETAEEDPRQELVARLLEYKKFQQVSELLQGQVLITPGITALPQHIRIRLMAAVIDFRAFDAENDVWEDHSFGIVKLDGVEAFWKIDLLNLCGDGFGALTVEDAINPMLTRRFLTIGLRSED